MAFAQLTFCESLRDIECCLQAMNDKLYHMGVRGKISRSPMADANEKRDWRIYRDFAQTLITQSRKLYAGDDFGVQLNETVYALDATIIGLCLSVFPWAKFRRSKVGVKLHTIYDPRDAITTFVAITVAKVHELNIVDRLAPEIGAIYVMDCGYMDFERLFALIQTPAFFVVLQKVNTRIRRLSSFGVDKSCGLRCDQIAVPTVFYARKAYPAKLRRIKYFDNEQQK
jgi:hypothetical protein